MPFAFAFCSTLALFSFKVCSSFCKASAVFATSCKSAFRWAISSFIACCLAVNALYSSSPLGGAFHKGGPGRFAQAGVLFSRSAIALLWIAAIVSISLNAASICAAASLYAASIRSPPSTVASVKPCTRLLVSANALFICRYSQLYRTPRHRLLYSSDNAIYLL